MPSADADRLQRCFDALLPALALAQPGRAPRRETGPVLTVEVGAASGLPKGRHAPGVFFKLVVADGGAVTQCGPRGGGGGGNSFTSAQCDEDVAPEFNASCSFVVADYAALKRGGRFRRGPFVIIPPSFSFIWRIPIRVTNRSNE